MSEKFDLSDKQKEIIKSYLEENFMDVSTSLPIDHDMVIRDIAGEADFFESDKEADEFFKSDLYREYSDAGRHGTLQTYEGYADFFKTNCDLDLADKDYSAEMGDIPDDLSQEAESYNNQGMDSSETSGDAGSASEGGKESNARVSHEKRRQAEKKYREQLPKRDEMDPRSAMSPDDRAALNLGRKMRKSMVSAESLVNAPGALLNLTTGALGGMAGSMFGSARHGFQSRSINKQIQKSERTGIIPNADIGKRLIEKRMGNIARQEASIAKIYDGLKENPSSQKLRQDLHAQSLKLMNNITRTSRAVDTVGDVAPDLKSKFSDRLEKSGKKMNDFMKKQEFLDLNIFSNLQKYMKNMMESITNLMKFKKKGQEASPT